MKRVREGDTPTVGEIFERVATLEHAPTPTAPTRSTRAPSTTYGSSCKRIKAAK